MILCVALSPALDVTYHVDQLRAHQTNRVRSVTTRAGGKAVNVARLLHALGVPVRLVLPVGGPTGELLGQELRRTGIAFTSLEIPAETRRTVTVVDDQAGDATVLTEPGRLTRWPELLDAIAAQLPHSDVVVASGSLPDGAPTDAYAQLTRAARATGRPAIIDTSGAALTAALAAGPAVVKPNLAELQELTGTVEDPMPAARRLAGDTGTSVVLSLGADGLIAITPDGTWRAGLHRTLAGNPTGAGDAVVAALARGRFAGAAWPSTLADAVALAGAAVLAPAAGEFDPAEHASLRAEVRTEAVAA